jgi:hypothetical protein
MAYHDAMIVKWATLSAGTTAQKLAQLNVATATGAADPMIATHRCDGRCDASPAGHLSRNLVVRRLRLRRNRELQF